MSLLVVKELEGTSETEITAVSAEGVYLTGMILSLA